MRNECILETFGPTCCILASAWHQINLLNLLDIDVQGVGVPKAKLNLKQRSDTERANVGSTAKGQIYVNYHIEGT